MIDVEVAEEKEREAEDNILKQCCEMERDREWERERQVVSGRRWRKRKYNMNRKAFKRQEEYLLRNEGLCE